MCRAIRANLEKLTSDRRVQHMADLEEICKTLDREILRHTLKAHPGRAGDRNERMHR